MIEHLRYVWQNLVLTGVAILAGILIIHYLPVEDMPFPNFLSMVLYYSLVNILAWEIMYRGITKKSRDGMVVLLAGLGIKFLFYLAYILIYWLVVKNIGKAFIVTFFALYLGFTFLLAINLFKLLKNK